MGPDALKKSWSLRKNQIVRRVLQADPGQEYFVYVPSSGGDGAPVFVAIHGISRNALELANLFASFAEALGVVMVVPHFPADRFGDYQRLGCAERGLRPDIVLDSILQEVAWLTGAETTQAHLFGYSGGAQFAHRYAMAYPQRVAGAVVASAGWYTLPTQLRRFPYGIKPHKRLPGVRFDPEEFLLIPMAVMVGEMDLSSEGLRHSERLDREQGVTRVERARNWVEAMRQAAAAYHVEPRVSLEIIAGGEHSFSCMMQQSQLGERVFEALFGLPFKRTESRRNDRRARHG